MQNMDDSYSGSPYYIGSELDNVPRNHLIKLNIFDLKLDEEAQDDY